MILNRMFFVYVNGPLVSLSSYHSPTGFMLTVFMAPQVQQYFRRASGRRKDPVFVGVHVRGTDQNVDFVVSVLGRGAVRSAVLPASGVKLFFVGGIFLLLIHR